MAQIRNNLWIPLSYMQCLLVFLGDERLSNKEFVAVMKRRLMRGLERPRETGFAKLFTAITACSKSMIAEQLTAIKETIVD